MAGLILSPFSSPWGPGERSGWWQEPDNFQGVLREARGSRSSELRDTGKGEPESGAREKVWPVDAGEVDLEIQD